MYLTRAMKQIDKINLPTRIITANNDIEVCQEIADVMAQKIPGSQKIIIADPLCTHMFWHKDGTKKGE